jgi:4-hydroxy-tetrahydrodipicolinate reductase
MSVSFRDTAPGRDAMVRIVVSGICGRMGSDVAAALIGREDMRLAGGVERADHRNLGRKLCDIWESGAIDIRVRGALDELPEDGFDAIVDFSVPEQTLHCARHAERTGKALVAATTGLHDDAVAALRDAARRAPVVVAPNTCLGVNLLFALSARVASALGPGFDIEIVETHHRAKRDAPSGTAARLVEVLSEAEGSDPSEVVRYGRHGLTGPRPLGEIGVHSVRGGAVAGRHDVCFLSDLEVVTLRHEALSKRAFTEGALAAARFAASAAPGLYGMEHVLGLFAEGTGS